MACYPIFFGCGSFRRVMHVWILIHAYIIYSFLLVKCISCQCPWGVFNTPFDALTFWPQGSSTAISQDRLFYVTRFWERHYTIGPLLPPLSNQVENTVLRKLVSRFSDKRLKFLTACMRHAAVLQPSFHQKKLHGVICL